MNQSAFNIYNASAGSGKTFALVKEYLKILFSSNQDEIYKNVLALTFTNKAVGEMKERIINALKEFSNQEILSKPNSMFKVLCKELSTSPEIIHKKSNSILENIVHNYAAFDVSTIDKFTQRVIGTFAYDLNLPLNFEVELDTANLLAKAVDNLIARAGRDKILTNSLIEFALEKTDDDKSWDVSYDLNNIASLLIKENDQKYIEQLQSKELSDFNNLKRALQKRTKLLKENIIAEAVNALNIIAEHQVDHNSFLGKNGYLPSYFVTLKKENFNVTFNKAWMDKLETLPLYPKTTDSSISSAIDGIQPSLVTHFNTTKQLLTTYGFLRNVLANITPLSLLTEISKELKLLKEDQNLLLISEFNNIISNHIKEQPVPFIYERLGERYKHYFIDEFQDTSILQWENLIPLIDNALSGENASAMLVGDAKQAIYRWRGGKAEQFIGLYNQDNPFQIEKHLEQLPKNYRSAQEIVRFNNGLFKHLSTFAFSNPSYQAIYEDCQQESVLDLDGYININFLDITKDDDVDLLYADKTLQTVYSCLEKGYKASDICILTRKRKEGVAIAKFLTEAGINITSSETLLINNSSKVRFIINLLYYVSDTNNLIKKLEVLNFIGNQILELNDIHEFYKLHVDLPIEKLFHAFSILGMSVELDQITHSTLYEAIESIVYGFSLNKESDAYVQFFLDFAFDYSAKKNTSISNFIEHYNNQKEVLSIVSSDNQEAIRIMTIHKAKGLEFPVVIFPFADLDIYREKNPKTWFPINDEEFHNFPLAYVNYNKTLADVNELGEVLYQERQAELELDNINLLYVALTRPIEQLYIISNNRIDKSGNENLKYYSGLLINYLKQQELWNPSRLEYSFGNNEKKLKIQEKEISVVKIADLISTPKQANNIQIVTNSGVLWDTEQQNAIERGNLIHDLMAMIKTEVDIDITLDHFMDFGIINTKQVDELKNLIDKVVKHPDLAHLFDSKNTIYNEREIITPKGEILRPDRIVINPSQETTILDYKTGKYNYKHEQQLYSYSDILNQMNQNVTKRILVYINDDLEIKEV